MGKKIRREIKEFISFCVYEEGSNLLVRSESGLNKMCFLFKNRRVTVHQMSEGSEFLLVKKSNRDFRLENNIQINFLLTFMKIMYNLLLL